MNLLKSENYFSILVNILCKSNKKLGVFPYLCNVL